MCRDPGLSAMFSKVVVDEPEIAEVPVKSMVPLLLLKVLLLMKSPATFRVPVGALRVPDTVMFSKVVIDEPEIEEVPAKSTVPEPALNVPLLMKLPEQLILETPEHVIVAVFEIIPTTESPESAETPTVIVPSS